MGKSSNDNVRLLVISGVIKFGATKLLTKIGQESFGLGEDHLNADAISITFNFKKEIEVRRSQDRR